MKVAEAYHRKRVLVSKEMTFDAAHKLNDYEGACKRLHGHTYKLIIGISGKTDRKGMVIDFSELKRIWEENIKPYLDHQYLNEKLPEMNTTAENMSHWLFSRFDRELSNYISITPHAHTQDIQVEFIKLYETPTSYAEIRREWYFC